MDKIYFYDLGVRNTLINNMNPLSQRDDAGKLWENFLIMERKKQLAYQFDLANTYFWRTYTGAALDYVEEKDGKLYGYAFKFGKCKEKAPHTWVNTYLSASYACINQSNFYEFVT